MKARPAKRAYAGLTDIGRVRTHNEDSVLLEPPLFVVADGLGGHEAGEVASSIAVASLLDAAPARADSKALGRAVREANRAVIMAAREGRGREGMGTTLTAAVVEGLRITVAHVGDSRAYLLHGDVLERVTRDHSMVADMIAQGTLTEEEARVHPNRSVITRALGTDPNMYADIYEIDASPGDRLLLCSDGLTGMLTDEQIAEMLGEYGDPELAARALVDAANDAGGHDNISVVIVDISGTAHVTPGRPHRTWLAVLIWTLALLAVVSIAVGGTYRYASDRAFLIAEDGVVVVYRGLPGEFASVSLNWRAEETTIPVSLLDPVAASRLTSGIQVENLKAAGALVEQYRAIAEARAPYSDEPAEGP
ncbi:MAG: Stp1/IreP family PP2C-type Ser/Thr phosphatase [Coriobacteriia bacterium]|jgi:protein phosphatase|nr:Stp1/IreP family PP2C-type Ser/Thr phosphatase [Coriobacteriia bacterium]